MDLIELLTNADRSIGPRITMYLNSEEVVELGRALQEMAELRRARRVSDWVRVVQEEQLANILHWAYTSARTRDPEALLAEIEQKFGGLTYKEKEWVYKWITCSM